MESEFGDQGNPQPDSAFNGRALNEFRWFEESKPLSDWDKYSTFEKVSLQLVGYDPANRDEFEIQVITAEIKPEKVARGVDYARLFATEDGGSVSVLKDYGRDKGDVSAIGPDDGFNRRERVTAWRQNKSLLIIKASYPEEKAQQVEPDIAKFLGSVKLDTTATDSIEGAMHWEKLPASGDAVYAARLPDGWKKLTQNSDPNPSYTGSIFTNSNDPDGNSAISLFIFPTPKSSLSPTDEQLRQLAAKVVEIELQNLMPDVGFKLDQDVSFVPDEKIGNTDRGFIDIVTLQGSGEKIRARTLLTVKGGVVVAVASLTAFSSHAERYCNNDPYGFRVTDHRDGPGRSAQIKFAIRRGENQFASCFLGWILREHVMNQIPDPKALLKQALSLPEDAWEKLMRLAAMVEFDGAGTLIIRNGEARFSLHPDGSVRVEGKTIIQTARQNIALDAAYIDLN